MRVLAFLIAAIVCLGISAPKAEAASKIAVVDLVQAIQKHPSTKKIEDKWRKAQQDAKAADERDMARIKEFKTKLDLMLEDDPKRLGKEKQLVQLENNRKFNYEWANLVAVRDYTRELEKIYAGVRAVVSKIAREKGYDLVLIKTEPNQKLNSSDPQDFAVKSRLRVVLYSDPASDITEAVIAQLKKS